MRHGLTFFRSAKSQATDLIGLDGLPTHLAQSKPWRLLLLFAAYEARAVGSPTIDGKHLLLAALRGNRRFLAQYGLDPGMIRGTVAAPRHDESRLRLSERVRSLLEQQPSPEVLVAVLAGEV